KVSACSEPPGGASGNCARSAGRPGPQQPRSKHDARTFAHALILPNVLRAGTSRAPLLVESPRLGQELDAAASQGSAAGASSWQNHTKELLAGRDGHCERTISRPWYRDPTVWVTQIAIGLQAAGTRNVPA